MNSEYEFISTDEFFNSIADIWSIDTVVDFLENQSSNIKFEIDLLNSQKETALEVLVKDGMKSYSSRDKEVILLMLKHGANPLKICLHGGTIAAKVLKNSDSEFVMKFFDQIEDINVSIGGDSPFYAIHSAVIDRRQDLVEYFIKRKADLTKKATMSITPLHRAVEKDNLEITRLLLENGADSEAKEFNGETPLFYALNQNNFDQVKLLIDFGANLRAKDKSGKTVLHALCAYYGELDVDICSLLLEKGCDPNWTDFEGRTPLQELLEMFHKYETDHFSRVVQLFMNYGANLNLQTNEGNTVLHQATRVVDPSFYVSKKEVPPSNIENFVKLAELCVEHGANLNITNNDGNTALHMAANLGDELSPFMITLIENGADINITNDSNQCFLELYRQNEDLWCYQPVINAVLLKNIQVMVDSDFTDPVFHSLISDERFEKVLNLFRHEYMIMNTMKIEEDLSYFDLFSSSEGEIAELCRSEAVRIKMSNFKAFPDRILGNELLKRYKAGLRLYEAELEIEES